MINYIKSENYRLLHSKWFYMYTLICNFLIIAAAVVLYYSEKYVNQFPYANLKFYLINVVTSAVLIVVIGVLMNIMLYDKESKALMKVSTAMDISIPAMFLGKFIVFLFYFTVMCLICLITVIISGNVFLGYDADVMNQFIISLANMVPLIFGGLALGHTLNSSRLKSSTAVFLTVIIYFYVPNIFLVLKNFNDGLGWIYKFSPGALFSENMRMYASGDNTLGLHYWLIGLSVGVVVLVIGFLYARKFEFKD